MSGSLIVVSVGTGCTIQDAGRIGYLRHGVANSGPMDWIAFAQAQRMAGLAPIGDLAALAGIEVSIGGIVLEARGGPVRLGLAGGDFKLAIDGRAVRQPASVLLQAGSRLSVRAGPSGAWFYVVPWPGLAASAVMGSRSTHMRFGLGPLSRGMLKAGDKLPLADGEPYGGADVHALAWDEHRQRVRVVLGPQQDYFDADALDEFLSSSFALALQSDRMAYLLEGHRIFPHSTYDIVSDATALGSVQVAGDGTPCVLMADRPPTGGYPKIATMIRADVGAFAQLRAGDAVRFETVSREEAVAALRAVHLRLADVSLQSRPFAIDLTALARGDNHTGFWSDHLPDQIVPDQIRPEQVLAECFGKDPPV